MGHLGAFLGRLGGDLGWIPSKNAVNQIRLVRVIDLLILLLSLMNESLTTESHTVAALTLTRYEGV